jgi:mRNA interferase RelE/StbE
MPLEIQYSTEAAEDISALRAFDRSKIRSAISEHLAQDPTRVSQSRIKEMRQPFWSQFRLRVGDFRVYYDVDDEAQSVRIVRVLRKGSGMTPENLS